MGMAVGLDVLQPVEERNPACERSFEPAAASEKLSESNDSPPLFFLASGPKSSLSATEPFFNGLLLDAGGGRAVTPVRSGECHDETTTRRTSE